MKKLLLKIVPYFCFMLSSKVHGPAPVVSSQTPSEVLCAASGPSSGFRKKLSILPLCLLCWSVSLAQLPEDSSGTKRNTDDTLVNEAGLQNRKIQYNRNSLLYVPPIINLTDKQKRNRTILISGVNVIGYGGSLILFSSAWYKDFPKSKFHTFNDSKEWLQVDKVGHAWAAYNTGKASSAMWQWTGMSNKKATLLGGISGAAYLTVIEFLDGRSSQWGWSWADIAANLTGSGLFISQQLAWQEQRIQFKFSFHKKNYGEPQLNKRADNLYGTSWYERMLKDYNGQTYWFSANIKSFFPDSKLPAWLNIAAGYGADGMFGGFSNQWTETPYSSLLIDRSDIKRVRQFYLAPDIDFTKIKTNKKWLRTAFHFLNAFKMPAPALMIDCKGKFKAYALYF
jgi:uncharacterized protein YfiM (DUF2279 family)